MWVWLVGGVSSKNGHGLWEASPRKVGVACGRCLYCLWAWLVGGVSTEGGRGLWEVYLLIVGMASGRRLH